MTVEILTEKKQRNNETN